MNRRYRDYPSVSTNMSRLLSGRLHQGERHLSALLNDQGGAGRGAAVSAAEHVAAEAVRDFEHGLFELQKRFTDHEAHELREFTSEIVAHVRELLDGSPMFMSEPLPPWEQDSIAQAGISACEAAIQDRLPSETHRIQL